MKPELVVNGRARELGEVGGHVTLLEWLRADGLTGCKEGCAEGECGACAVLVARPDGPDRTRWVAINACLVPAAAFDQQEVVTAEGLGRPGQLHPVQREMAERGGSQCGYCTPGFICSMAAEYYRPGRRPAGAVLVGRTARGERLGRGSGPRGERIGRERSGLGAASTSTGRTGSTCMRCRGNLCRCTGYRPIRDAAYALGPAGGRRSVPGPAGRARAGARGHHDLERAGPLRPPARPGRGPRAARRPPGRAAGGRIHRLGRGAEHQARPGRR